MKWKKLGKIFDPAALSLQNGVGFAQSPQALVFDKFVRIYFSTRIRDINGKFLSHIGFVDFNRNLDTIVNVSSKPVIPLGELGAFDEHGIFPISPFRHEGKIMAYTCGWSRRVSVSVETSTGLAISHDNGETFVKVGSGPIMSSSLHEPFLVGDSFVRHYNHKYYMWYIFGEKWLKHTNQEPPDRVYKIAQATSTDGIEWTRNGRAIIEDKLNEFECQALPTVVKIDQAYHMVFCYREAVDFRKNDSNGYRLGYAKSKDLITWTRDDENLGLTTSVDSWDSSMLCYPNLFQVDKKVYLLYNGNEFGRHGFGLAVLEQE